MHMNPKTTIKNLLFITTLFALFYKLGKLYNTSIFTDYSAFTAWLLPTVLIIGLMGLFIVVLSDPSKPHFPTYQILLLSITLSVATTVAPRIVFNPLGVYPWNKLPLYLSGGMRSLKLDLFNQQESAPQIIIFGSSRAHLLSGQTLKQKFGYTAFNWTTEGGGPVDTLISLQYLASQSTPPKVLLVDISPVLMTANWQTRTPLAMFPYTPQPFIYEAIKEQFIELFKFNSVSESLFTYIYLYKFVREHPEGNVAPDGTLIINFADDPVVYAQKIDNDHSRMKNIVECKGLLPDGQIAMQEIARVSAKEEIAIVFYINPLNADFLNKKERENPEFQSCMQRIDQFVTGLTQARKNVFYRNLIYYPEVSDLGMDGYADIEHIRTIEIANKVIDALEPEIRSALEWANLHR